MRGASPSPSNFAEACDAVGVPRDALELLADLVADRVAERLGPRAPGPTTAEALVDAATVAAALGVSRAFVYEHADELGARRLPGIRGRLRFDITEARAAWASRSAPPSPDPVPQGAEPRRRKPAATATGAPLLPVRGQREAA